MVLNSSLLSIVISSINHTQLAKNVFIALGHSFVSLTLRENKTDLVQKFRMYYLLFPVSAFPFSFELDLVILGLGLHFSPSLGKFISAKFWSRQNIKKIVAQICVKRNRRYVNIFWGMCESCISLDGMWVRSTIFRISLYFAYSFWWKLD